jgi:nucleotide-binding universal stress UspA family protein
MDLHHLVAAVDESDAGREAVHTALDLARRCVARVTIMRTVPLAAERMVVGTPRPKCSASAGTELEVERLWRWIAADLPPLDDRPPLDVVITLGIPGVEICRFAEDSRAGLLILGRKQRTPMARMLLGDTADAVARRSRVPCLFVPPGARPVLRMLAALDGTERGRRVLDSARLFAAGIGAKLQAVTVEAVATGEPEALALQLPRERSLQLRQEVRRAGSELDIRRGAIVPEILAAVDDTEADALVLGYHRGGPAGVIEAGSTARRLAHLARCAVLTIPL